MTWYTFQPQAAVNLSGAPVNAGAFSVYAITDTGFTTPLVARDPITHVVLATVPVDDYVTVAFEVEDHQEVYLRSGAAPAVAVFSAQGMRAATQTAQEAATAAQIAAAASAVSVAAEVSQAQTARNEAVEAAEEARAAALPSDAQVAGFLADAGSATRAAMTKATVGLGNVDNTADADKPISTAVAAALAGKMPLLADPNADRIPFWDDSASAVAWLTPSTGLTVSGTSMTVRAASEAQTGIVELATAAETATGTDTGRAVHPAGLKAELDKKAAVVHAQSASTITGGVLAGTVALGHVAAPMGKSPKAGNLSNGAQYAELQPYATSNAFPGLARCPNGDLIAVWRRAASHNRGNKGDIYLSRSTDMGKTWSTPAVALTHATMDYRDPALTVLADGRIGMVFFQDDGTKAAGVLVAFSSDHGATWSAPTAVNFARAYSNASSGPMVQLANGDLLVCGYGATSSTNDTNSRWDVRVMKSTDGGATWGSSVTVANGVTDNRAYSEAWMGLLPDGATVQMLIRCDGAPSQIYRSTSTNGGSTWTAVASVLSSAYGRPSWTRLASGGLVCTYRRSADGAAMYSASWDNGLTWSAGALLDDVPPAQSVYQQLVEIAPGLVGVVYADETSATSSRVRFRYLADGPGVTPYGDLLTTGGGSLSSAPFAFATNWGDNAGETATATKDPNGWVELTGAALRTASTVSSAQAGPGTIPAGYRPAAVVQRSTVMWVLGGATTSCEPVVLTIATDGTVTANFGTSRTITAGTSYIVLGGIRYKAAP